MAHQLVQPSAQKNSQHAQPKPETQNATLLARRLAACASVPGSVSRKRRAGCHGELCGSPSCCGFARRRWVQLGCHNALACLPTLHDQLCGQHEGVLAVEWHVGRLLNFGAEHAESGLGHRLAF